jgi:ABC-2 type transport system permease protein
MSATWTLTKVRIRLAMRNRMFFFFSVLMPIIFLFITVLFVGHKSQGGVGNYILGDLLTVTVMGSFFGLSVQLVTFREQGILRRFRLAPIGAGPMLASSILANYVTALPVLSFDVLLCRWALHLQNLGNPLDIFLLITFGSAAFSSFGLVIASVTNTMQETQIINQLIWMGFLFLSGATIPLTVLPIWIRRAALFMPATYLATGLETSAIGTIVWRDAVTDLIGLAVALLVSFEISRRIFRWEPEAKVSARSKLWVVAAMIPFFVFGTYENIYGNLLNRVDSDIQLLFNGGHDASPSRPDTEIPPHPSAPR